MSGFEEVSSSYNDNSSAIRTQPDNSSQSSSTGGFRNKLRAKIDKVATDFSRLGTAVATTWNPNHRHDEAWEQEIDSKLEAIRDSHRFRSFAPDREHNIVKWHIDGHDYFWALSEIIDQAKESIMILDWWLSPELQLRRPAAYFPEWRLDRLLQRKADEGVRVYIMVYKEVTASMSLGSKHTKHALEDLHQNIAVMRHPDHSGGELVYYFSHHEKLCVVDNKVAAMGGLDACFGRWDTQNHPLADVHPAHFPRTLFPGQDYNNSRIMDFQTVDKFASNELATQDATRMPWHDTSLTIVGPTVVDLVQHFCERWNFVKGLKYKHDHRMEWLALPAPWDTITRGDKEAAEELAEERVLREEHPHLARFKELGRQFGHPYHNRTLMPRAQEQVPAGSMRVQVVRSCCDWSHGTLTEDSIQQAYIELIREANHCIYIENQFCDITTTREGGPIKNLIGAALVERIVSAHRDGRKFKVFVLIPEVPAFPGDIQSNSGLKAIMEAQYRSINRGGSSILERLREEGVENPEEYITWWNLRSYDRINAPRDVINQMQETSGVKFHQAQVALARVFVGGKSDEAENDEVVYIEEPHDQSTDPAETNKKRDTARDAVPLPRTVDDAIEIIKHFEEGACDGIETISDNIGQHALRTGHSLLEERWAGSEQEERDCLVTELLYIHTKLMIVDDRRVICGSANLNDRSQKGTHDSEIAIVIEDNEMVETTMGGRKFMAGRIATTWRRALMREHLGLMPAPPPVSPDNQPTAYMRPAPIGIPYDFGSPDDLAVADVLSDEFNALWNQTATVNRQVFDNVFRTVPTSSVHNWAQYKEYIGQNTGVMTGHVANKDLSLEEIKHQLATIRGHLVPMPLDFLCEEKNLTDGDFLSVNPLTLAIYI